jgi:hypothetical protein
LEQNDFGLGFVSGVGGEVDSSVVFDDFGFAFLDLLGVFVVGFVFLEDQVLSDFSEHDGDVGKGGVVLDLEGDGVEDLSSEFRSFDFLELLGDGGLGAGKGDSLVNLRGAGESDESEEGNNDSFVHFCFFGELAL